MIIGVILARGGSKRLPGKNMKTFAGLPMCAWSMRAAQETSLIDYVIVSTDDPDIAAVAFEENCVVVRRPTELAQDETTSYQALLHLIDLLELSANDRIVLLQPTSPLRTFIDIKYTIRTAQKGIKGVAVSVTEGRAEPNGAIYVAPVDWLLIGGNWDHANCLLYEMPAHRSHDIDTIDDFERAENDYGK